MSYLRAFAVPWKETSLASDLTALMLLDQIVEAAERLAILVSESTSEAIADDWRTYDAICLGLIRIGENVSALPDHLKTRLAGPPWQDIVGMRNRIAHGYTQLNKGRVWDTASLSVPPFAEQIRRLRSELEAN